ncbi:MAG: hypothetical protein GX748_08955, partial [Lentisphaerae bacterium]|nr:hypothetical protein [Lentisphaerota bacterium]
PVGGYKLVDSDIVDQNSRDAGDLWTGLDPKSGSLHRYHLSSAYSSQEYVMIDGTIAKLGPGGGGGAGGLPPFRVTVPSVDVDWTGFGQPADEEQEETRFIIVPLNTNRVDDIRRLMLDDPYDDDERNGRPDFPYGKPVNPDITLHWDAGNSLALLGGGNVFTGEITINAKSVSWPLDYAVKALDSDFSFRIFARGQADNVTGEKAIDTIHGRIVNVDIDVDANHDGKIDNDDEPLEENPGGLACVCTNKLTPIMLTLQPAGLPGKLTLSATMGGHRIRIWKDAGRSAEVVLTNCCAQVVPGTLYVEGVTNSTAARDVELRLEYDENPQGQSNPLFKCEDRVRLTVIKAEFIDDIPDYSQDVNTDSDNFFLRETNASSILDSVNLDIYYRILPVSAPVANVKIKIYKGESSTPELVLDGEKNAGGNYKTGDGLHIKWTPEIDGLAEDHPGFYRLQLAVSVEGQDTPVLETAIADADDATPGWQCPQDCLAVHDLVWKHRPIIHCHPDDLGRPSNLDRFLANVGGHTKELAGNAIITNTPPAIPGTINTFYDLFDDNRATIGDLSEFTAAQRNNVLASAVGAETVYHTAVPPGGTGGAPTHTFLQYWMFYNFSTRMFGLPIVYDPGLPDVQHEGDVEHCQIAVRLKDPSRPGKKAAWITPFGATASQHYYAQTLRWDLNDGSAAANSHVQTHVEHQNGRLVIYVARGAHATYFVADNSIPIPVLASQCLGTQTMYDETAYLIYDLTVTGIVTSYGLRHVAPELKTFNGRFGFFNPALTGHSAHENGPAGLPHRAARVSSTHELNLRDNARELHNRAIRTVSPDQTAEMTIQP